MNIKTLTTFDVYNYGASLQAYALQQYLIQLGHDVEIIDYQPNYLTRKYDYKWVNPESKFNKFAISRVLYRCLKFIQRQTTIGRKNKFDHFHNESLIRTSKRYTSLEQLNNDPPEADLFVVGSDQIWNVFYETGRDPAFYLDFVHKGKKSSYAASFSYLDIDKNNLKRIKESLSSFCAISVRERHGLEILEKIGIEGKWVLDPIFLLSIEQWKSQMVSLPINDPYILVYDFEGNDRIKRFVKEYAKRHNLKIVCIVDTYPYLYANSNFTSAGPKEFLSLIYNCNAFVSNSFHGTAFSILFHKPVYVFSRHRHKVNSRMESILSLFGLENCLDPLGEVDFDWSKIDDFLDAERNQSMDFINSLLVK